MAYEQGFNTFLTNATLTEQAVGQPIEFRGFGAGGGGARPTGDVGQNASGGGGEGAKVTKSSAEASYALATGTGGLAGLDSAATDGSDTTVTDSGGVILRAKGGQKGVAANPTGTAGAGGTGGVGDVTNAGGAGTAGAANTNAAGGASGGTSTAASGSTAGAPDGGPANNSNANGNLGAGGPRRSNAAARDGGHGWIEAYYSRLLANLDFPYVPVGGIERWRDTGNLTARALPIPGGHQTGDRLLVIASIDGTIGLSSIAGAVKIIEGEDDTAVPAITLAIFAVNATGSDSLTLVTASEISSGFVIRIRNAAPVASWDATGVQISPGQMDGPLHTHAGGVKNMLWLAAAAVDPNVPITFTAFPSGFDRNLLLNGANASNTNAAALASFKAETGDSKNPGAWASTNTNRGFVVTLAIPGPAEPIEAEPLEYETSFGAVELIREAVLEAEPLEYETSFGSVDLIREVVREATPLEYELTFGGQVELTPELFEHAPQHRIVRASAGQGHILRVYRKDPSEDLDYEIDWSGILKPDEALSTSTWTLMTKESSPALEIYRSHWSGGSSVFWTRGGTHGVDYFAINRVETNAGRTYERALRFRALNSAA